MKLGTIPSEPNILFELNFENIKHYSIQHYSQIEIRGFAKFLLLIYSIKKVTKTKKLYL